MLRARLHKEVQATALPGDDGRDVSPLVFVSRGGELLKRTRQGIFTSHLSHKDPTRYKIQQKCVATNS
jgi:hypothetical protein